MRRRDGRAVQRRQRRDAVRRLRRRGRARGLKNGYDRMISTDIHINLVDHSPSSSEAALESARTRGDIDIRWRADAGEWMMGDDGAVPITGDLLAVTGDAVSDELA